MNATAPQRTAPPAPSQGESLRETFDSIVIALILAFVFRAFIIEAFVIPTGSMASTLNGAHGTMVCRSCGWEFSYGLTDPSVSGSLYDDESVAQCPNCRYENTTDEVNDRRRNCESGDRILVLKWTYDIGGATLGPRRWDVVVFKDPSDGVQNYIKRLVGLPNDVLQIVDGDVYTVEAGALSAEARQTLDDDRHIKYLRTLLEELNRRDAPARIRLEDLAPDVAARMDRYELDRLDAELQPRRDALLAELDGKLRICRKPNDAQRDLWRVVHNLDYPPREPGAGQPQWVPQNKSAWTINERKLRCVEPSDKEQVVSLSAPIDSTCSYNTQVRMRRGGREGIPVADLRIGFVLDYLGRGDGAVATQLSKRDDHFKGELAADGTVHLLHATAAAPHEWQVLASTQVPRLQPNHKIEFAMQNLDYQVSLWVDGNEVLTTTEKQYGPDIHALRQGRSPPVTLPPRIIAHGIEVELSHVVVEHDIYYVSQMPSEAVPLGYHAWGVENHPVALRGHEFFMLGDNSAQSKDSRLWNYVGTHLLDRGEEYQLGTVPHDQLIGRAFFVYWPSGLRTSVIPYLRNTGWIPNFGRMRWIR